MNANDNNTLFADLDFDAEGRVVKNISAQSAADPLLHFIVQRMLRGETLTAEEHRYYQAAAPQVVRVPRDAA